MDLSGNTVSQYDCQLYINTDAHQVIHSHTHPAQFYVAMRFTLLFVATLASFANAFPASSSKRDSSPLAVTLEVQNTLVKANVVNKGPNAIKLLHLGNLLDSESTSAR